MKDRIDNIMDKHGEDLDEGKVLDIDINIHRFNADGKIYICASTDNEEYQIEVKDKNYALQDVSKAISNLILKLENKDKPDTEERLGHDYPMLERMVSKYIQKHYGRGCEEFDEICGECMAWLCYYYLFDIDKLEWDTEEQRWKIKEEIMG